MCLCDVGGVGVTGIRARVCVLIVRVMSISLGGGGEFNMVKRWVISACMCRLKFRYWFNSIVASYINKIQYYETFQFSTICHTELMF